MSLSNKLKKIQNRGVYRASWVRFQATLKGFNLLVKLPPKNAEAYINRGAARLAVGEHKSTIERFIEAFRLNFKSVSGWNKRGLFRNKLGGFKSEIRDFAEVLWQQPQPIIINLSDEEYAAALVAGFEPETGEQLFSRPHIRELIEEYQEAEGRQKESLLYLIGGEGGVITVEDAQEIYMQVQPKLLEHHSRKVKQFIDQQLQTLIDFCPEVHREVHGKITISIHQRTELDKLKYGYSLRHSEWLVPGSPPCEPFTELDIEGNAEFERVLGNARCAVLDRNLRFIRSGFHQHILFEKYCTEVARRNTSK